jgi:monofunctional biosynthetic peptidoglycan transglycosylase
MKEFFVKQWRRIKRIVFFAFLLHLGYAIALIWIAPPYTMTMLADRLNGQAVTYDANESTETGSQIVLAALASEDQKFPDHYGIDFKAIKDVIKEKAKGKKLRGGSTISQQTAKNVFLWQGRSWIRKGLEAYSTMIIELLWSKERILEQYLRIAEMGKGVYGIQAAAKYYYNTTPSKLTAQQASAIICCLPSPKKRNPKQLTPHLKRKQNWILKQMKILAKDKDVKALLAN